MNKKIVVIGLSGQSIFMNVDHMNEPGETIKADDMFIESGGKGFNQAITIGKLGGDISFITCLGNDSYTNDIIDTLNKFNVNVLPIKKNVPSSIAVIITDKQGNNNVTLYGGASDLVTYNDIMKYKKDIDKADYLLLQLEFPIEVILKIINYALSKDIKVILNPAPAKIIDIDVLRKLYLLTPNENEVKHLVIDNTDLINSGLTNIICTQGSSNVITNLNGIIKEYFVKKQRAVDTTGAGDCFNGALVYYLSEGKTIDEAIRFAIIASRIAVTRKGVCNAIPELEEIIKEMR